MAAEDLVEGAAVARDVRGHKLVVGMRCHLGDPIPQDRDAVKARRL
jgi:hypothetical protein